MTISLSGNSRTYPRMAQVENKAMPVALCYHFLMTNLLSSHLNKLSSIISEKINLWLVWSRECHIFTHIGISNG